MKISETIQSQLENCRGAAERFFRLYQEHCMSPNQDTLFNLLNAIHSLNDRFRQSVAADFFGFDEFVALKALRNLFHRKQELVNEVKVIPITNDMPIISDLLWMCLVPKDLALQAIEEERHAENKPRIESALMWYDGVVDLNPMIFNFGVHAYEKTMGLGISISGDAVDSFQNSYQFEEEEGHSHFVSGKIRCRAGDVDKVLKAIYFSDRDVE